MKCLCGYEHKPGSIMFVGEYGSIIQQDEPFVLIQGTTIGEDSFHQLFFETNGKRVNISLYGCPNCGTVKMKSDRS